MKKAMFFSLSTIFLIVLIFLIFKSKSEILGIDRDFYISRAQLKTMDHFVRDFDGYYIEQILKTSSKQALVSRTKGPIKFTKANLADVMKDGIEGMTTYIDPFKTTDSLFSQSLKTLTFAPSAAEFDYTLEEIRQLTFSAIKIIAELFVLAIQRNSRQ